MRTQVFTHKGIVGIMSDPKAEGLLNEPLKPGQLGFVVDAAYVDISPEALELLKQVPKSGDDVGEVDVWESQGKWCFSWLGGPRKMFRPKDITGSSTYDPSGLKSVDTVVVPEEFKEAVEKYYNELT